VLLLSLVSLALAGVTYRGVNQAGAEFGESVVPGVLGTNYAWPNPGSIDYFVSNKVNVFRIPFLWERAQPTLGSFNNDYMMALDTVVNHTTKAGAYAIIDPHNYFRYHGQPIGQGTSYEAFYALWASLATRYQTNGRVIFNLMNEPNTVPTENVLTAMQGAINVIRKVGAQHLILVPGNAWTGGHSWLQNWYGTSNADTMGKITDPMNNWAYDIHQYLDFDYSGRNPTCKSDFDAASVLGPLTNWLKSKGFKAFLGEFGFAQNDVCYKAGKNILDHLENNGDAWIGWTYWAAGPMWYDYSTKQDYIYSVEPSNRGTAGQWTNVLSKYIDGSSQPTTQQPTQQPTTQPTQQPTTQPTTQQPTTQPTQQPTTKPSSTCSSVWQQCGGQGWSGPTCCQAGSTCKLSNPWYSQCLPSKKLQ